MPAISVSHTTHVLRMFKARPPQKLQSVPDVGCLSLDKLNRRVQMFYEACTSGVVIVHEVPANSAAFDAGAGCGEPQRACSPEKFRTPAVLGDSVAWPKNLNFRLVC